MTKLNLLFAFLLSALIGFSQGFNPDKIQNSIVKVMVTSGSKAGICTGFLWKDTHTIVTTLHSMREGGQIGIIYRDGVPRKAEIAAIYEDADLVLLKLKSGESPASGAVALTSYEGTVNIKEELNAMGYPGGAISLQLQLLKKGWANPENVRGLVVKNKLKHIQKMDIPDDKFDIYFLNSGSLIPGYSGSPIFNNKGQLVAIGDGGLEAGTMNISWAIPAKNLSTLESSNQTTLPANLKQLTTHYSAEVEIELKEEVGEIDQNQAASIVKEIEETAEVNYKHVSGHGFDFFQTKTRSWNKMQQTAIDPDNMVRLVEAFYNMDLFVDTSEMFFDVYEDINNNITVSIPKNCELVYSEEYQMFGVDMSNLPHGENFGLYYSTLELDEEEDAIDVFYDLIHSADDEGSHDFENLKQDESYGWTNDLGDGIFVDYGLLINEETESGNDLFVYATIVFNEEAAFFSLAICRLPLDNEDIRYIYEEDKADCIENYEKQQYECDFFESWLTVMGSSHLTMLSYVY